MGWAQFLVVTVEALVMGYPWLRVALASDDKEMRRAIKLAASVTVLAIAVFWLRSVLLSNPHWHGLATGGWILKKPSA